METHKKLTDTVIRKMTTSRLADTEVKGFVVKVGTTGEKRFYLEYRSPVDQKSKRMTLGKCADMPTAEARKLAIAARGNIAKGIDPQEKKKAQRVANERQKMELLGTYLETGFREVTDKKTADDTIPSVKLHFASYLNKPMSSITQLSLEKWKRAYKGAPSGANRVLNRLRGVLRTAVQAGLLDHSPAAGVKKLKEDKNQKIKYITHEEEVRLMDAIDARENRRRGRRLRLVEHRRARQKKAPEAFSGAFTDHIKPMIVILINTGLRRGELFNLKVSDIDLPARLLTVTGSGAKSKQTRQIELNDNVFSTLVAWLNQTGNSGLLFPSPKTGKRFDNINTAWRKIRKAAGLPELELHELRHTFGTRLAHNGVDLVTIKELMGHSSLDVTAKYLHTNNTRRRSAVDSLSHQA